MTAPYRVVACDFDGVIANSMPVIEKCWRDAIVAVAGSAPTEAAIANLYNGATAKRMFDATGVSDDQADAIRDVWRADWLARRHTVPLLDGVAETLPHLAARYTLVVASNAGREYLEIILRREALDGHFAHILGADDIAKLKPDPEILHHVAERTGVSLAEICMVGDTPADLGAAHAAGTGFVLMTGDTTDRPAADALSAHTGPTVSHWGELRDLLAP